MSGQPGGYSIPKIPCPECGIQISKNNILRHWKLHVSNAWEGESALVTPGLPPTQQQRSAPTDLPPEELVLGNKMSATPSVSSSIMSLTSEIIQYTVAARALLKRTESYTEQGLATFLSERYPEVSEGHRRSLIVGAVTGAQTAAQLHMLLDGTKSGCLLYTSPSPRD